MPFNLLDAQFKAVVIRGPQPSFSPGATDRGCVARGLREGSGQVANIGVIPCCSECQQTAESRPEQEAKAGGSQGRRAGMPGLRKRGHGPRTVPTKQSSLHSLRLPGAEAAGPSCQLSGFPQPEAPPSLSESNDFLKMDSLPSPSCN